MVLTKKVMILFDPEKYKKFVKPAFKHIISLSLVLVFIFNISFSKGISGYLPP